MPAAQRTLKDTIKDPSARKTLPRKNKKKAIPVVKIALALVLGFAGGFGTARFLRF
jgi:uncharacterized membrane protein YbaN (DUF454 family)